MWTHTEICQGVHLKGLHHSHAEAKSYHNPFVQLLWVEQVGGSPRFCPLKFTLVHVYPYDHLGPHFPQSIDDCQPYCAQAKHSRGGTLFHLPETLVLS